MSFKSLIRRASSDRRSRIVLALDLPLDSPSRLLERGLEILGEASPHLCAVKLNRQLVLPLGLEATRALVGGIHDLGLPAIMDCKLNDVGHTNAAIARYYFNVGFDALTASPFVGWEGGLQSVFEVAGEAGGGVILLVYMSHPGAVEGYGQWVVDAETGERRPQYLVFAEKALRWGADGVVVGATYPEKIREVFKVLGGEIPIFSPGVGAQGGSVEGAVVAGASYLIVGRSIINAEHPGMVAESLKERVNKALGR